MAGSKSRSPVNATPPAPRSTKIGDALPLGGGEGRPGGREALAGEAIHQDVGPAVVFAGCEHPRPAEGGDALPKPRLVVGDGL
jgi:hypothetical protein